MVYRFIENVSLADTAFEAVAPTLEELLRAAADATLSVMVADLNSVDSREQREVRVFAPGRSLESSAEALLHELLQKLVYFKDAQRLLLRMDSAQLVQGVGGHALIARLRGETIDPARHELVADVKAVTLHQFEVRRTETGWFARVVLDV